VRLRVVWRKECSQPRVPGIVSSSSPLALRVCISSMEDKVKKLEEATAVAQSVLAEKQTKLTSATDALDNAKAKLKALSPEAQHLLQVNDTELPELISAKMLAQEEYDEAKKRYDTNQKYLILFREKLSRGA